MPSKITPQKARLGARLQELRAAKFRSGSALARHLGWHQTRVNKIERGEQFPTLEDLDAWVAAVGVGPSIRDELAELLAHARMQYKSYAELYETDHITSWQTEIRETEAASTSLRGYQPSLVPGLLQTPAYAREMLNTPGGPALTGATPDRIEHLIAERIQRQQILYHPTKRLQIVLGEAALTVHFGSVGTLMGQLDRLVTLTGLPSVDLRVLPRSVACPVLPLSGFWIDDDAVYIETLTGEQTLADPHDRDVYVKAFVLLREAAVFGADTAALIQQVLAEMRE